MELGVSSAKKNFLARADLLQPGIFGAKVFREEGFEDNFCVSQILV